MARLRPLWLLALLCFALPVAAPRAQDNTDSVAQEDDSATTVEARQQALTTLLADARQARDMGELLKAARFMIRAGRLQLRLSLPQDALISYQDALEILKQTPDHSTQIDGLVGLGHVYNHLSKCDQAEIPLRQAIVLSEQNRYSPGKAAALLALSHCQNHADHALALSTVQESLRLWQLIGSKRGMAESYSAIGEYQSTQNQLTEAVQNYQAALNLWRELNISDEEAETLTSLGFVEYRLGAWQNVLTFLTQAQLRLDEKAEPYKMGRISAGLAATLLEIGMPEQGLKKYIQALEYYQQAQNPRAVIAMYLGVGRAHYFLGDYHASLLNLQRALTDAQSIKEPTIVAMSKESLGSTYFAMNDHIAALNHFQAALDFYTQSGNPMEAARTQALMGLVYQRQGKGEKASAFYQLALETFRRLSDRINESATLFALGRLKMEENNLPDAESYLIRSIAVTEDIHRASTSTDLTAAFSATVYERYQAYIDCLMRKNQAQPDRGFAALALETNELARARSLGEMLRSTATGFAPGVDPQLVAQEKSLRQSLRVKEDSKVRLLGGNYKREELALLEADLARLENDYKQVIGNIHARYPAFERLTRPGAWTLGQIQSQVIADDQTVLLEYSLGADKSYVWAVTRDSLKSYELPSQREINAAAGKLYELLENEPKAETENKLTQAAYELSQIVLSPLASELNKSRIIVVADGALNYIPFQLLPAPSTAGQQLVESYEVINAPSASVLGQLRQETSRRQRAENVLAAFGNPVFATNFNQQEDREVGAQLSEIQKGNGGEHRVARDIQPTGDAFDPAKIEQLVFANVELTNIRNVAGRHTLLATRFDATPEKLRATDLTKYSILHFATHGILHPKHPERSGLVLSTVNTKGQAQDGFVGLQDIYSLRAPVDLVVLSACRTGLGKDVRGEGVIGLTRGFIYAGASSVVASLWKVDDEATAELMKRFYSNMLQHGMRPADALRAAQNSIRQQPEWRAPYYWAAFTLQGEYLKTINHPAAAGSVYPKLIVGAFCLALLAAGGWWFSRRGRGSYSRAN